MRKNQEYEKDHIGYSLVVYFNEDVYHMKIRNLGDGFTIGEPKKNELVNIKLSLKNLQSLIYHKYI